jgi:hypothetical protein
MLDATEYRAMAADHHRLAGMCRSPESREQHLRMEKEFRAFAAVRSACTERVPRRMRAIHKSLALGRVPRR